MHRCSISQSSTPLINNEYAEGLFTLKLIAPSFVNAKKSCSILLRILYKLSAEIHCQSPSQLYAISKRKRNWPWVSNDDYKVISKCEHINIFSTHNRIQNMFLKFYSWCKGSILMKCQHELVFNITFGWCRYRTIKAIYFIFLNPNTIFDWKKLTVVFKVGHTPIILKHNRRQ